MHAMLLLGRRATRATISPMAATRLVAMRPLSSSLAVTARPAMATVARRAGLLSLAGSAASVVSGAVALAESKGWPSTSASIRYPVHHRSLPFPFPSARADAQARVAARCHCCRLRGSAE
jgi:hypothetical protein